MENTAHNTEATVNILENLIVILNDGKLGYTNAAESVEDTHLKTDFLVFARERSLMIVELQDEVNKLGKSTDTEGGPMGALHRAWIDLKSIFTGGDKEAIINACITGEKAAIEEYENALKDVQLNTMLHPVIIKQMASIQSTLARIEMKKMTSI
ncbi:hypothetical protein FFWV33_01385 [Flavobacterium faecale]|uniref:DUF2383 domain-containing protein n=1 Tax=Flavobacterium faecale TaxID=1355330 RepID=A0A2S1L966_9FLAO|nr:PA2169 family four-helix-bundle protein [Flavobacterium faecale]AWG20273.1 hypothetical protein FFWV33_01385 [Flavobacterium faecale]